MKKLLFVVVAAGLTAAFAAAATPAEKTGGTARVETAKAKVTAIAPETRVLLLKGEGGKVISLQVPEAVKNFPQIKVGDEVVARYYEAIAFEVKKPGEAAAPPSVTEAAAHAAPGQKPAGIIAGEVKATVEIMAIDHHHPSVTVKGPEGNVYDVAVKNPKNLEGLKVGDKVEVTYTQALAISVEEASKAPAAK
ncbi:MAG: hypothetical protein ACM3JH_12830 [Acidithiobacillales bacterium]